MNNQFAVIGLGLFGSALCEELQRQNAEVLAIDIDETGRQVDEPTEEGRTRAEPDQAVQSSDLDR